MNGIPTDKAGWDRRKAQAEEAAKRAGVRIESIGLDRWVEHPDPFAPPGLPPLVGPWHWEAKIDLGGATVDVDSDTFAGLCHKIETVLMP